MTGSFHKFTPRGMFRGIVGRLRPRVRSWQRDVVDVVLELDDAGAWRYSERSEH